MSKLKSMAEKKLVNTATKQADKLMDLLKQMTDKINTMDDNMQILNDNIIELHELIQKDK